jgi:Leucine-rich repeat (LRR) protein
MRGLLQRKIGSKLRVADMIAQYLPLQELRLVAFVREHSIVTYCERRWKEPRFYSKGLRAIRPIILYGFRNVTLLSLSGNQLQSIPDAIGNCAQLHSLDLDRNQLQIIPDTIGNCTQLQWLHLNRNKLQSIPDAIGNCMKLRALGLKGNPLKRRPVLDAKVKVYY